MKIESSVRYVSFAASAAALLWLANAGIVPLRHPLSPDQYLIETGAHQPRILRNFFRRPDVIIGLAFVFATAGPTITLPADFNVSSNQANAIGAGAPGLAGAGNAGGDGGGGGAFSQVANYSAHGAGQAVNVIVGAGDTTFDTAAILVAKAASLLTGGQASSSVGSIKFSGGNGGLGVTLTGGNSGGAGGGGGGAAGPNGAGNNGGDGGTGSGAGAGTGSGGGDGATGDGGNTPRGANGTTFDPTHGSGGGGDGGGPAANGSDGGLYGAGGGGGGNTANGGNFGPGLVAIGYTTLSPTGPRSYAFFLG